MSETVQYIIVGVIIAWALYRIFRKYGSKNNRGACCGCSLAETCAKARMHNEKPEHGAIVRKAGVRPHKSDEPCPHCIQCESGSAEHSKHDCGCGA